MVIIMYWSERTDYITVLKQYRTLKNGMKPDIKSIVNIVCRSRQAVQYPHCVWCEL